MSIVSQSQAQGNGIGVDAHAQSESEQYAIRSDILSSNEADLVVKSPTIESMSGKSFDDNISNPDYDSSEANQQMAAATQGITKTAEVVELCLPVGDGTGEVMEQERRDKKIERRYARLSSEIEPEELSDKNREYDEAIAQIKDEVSVLQSEFSKMSWDESMSATTGDFGSSTPDHDLQGRTTTTLLKSSKPTL